VILRFAGIYGPGRLMSTEALRRGDPLPGEPDKWINLIHAEDGAEVILRAEERATPGRVYNVSDGHPVTRGEFYAHMASLLGAAAPRFDADQPTARNRGNRRIVNQRLVSELGFASHHPSFREGLAASVAGQ
jgi:nucleoside-diphosphate-sugar epimerase